MLVSGNVMPRYTFDVHDDGPANWGEPGYECEEPADVERRARDLIAQAQDQQAARGAEALLTTVFVHEDGDGIALTAYGRPGENVRMVWRPN